MLVFVGVAICTSNSIAETQYEWKNNDEAINNGAIDVDILWPLDDTYVTINGERSLFCTASDPDCERNKPDGGEWSDWYPISDDVTSGDSSSDYHILWTCSGGGQIMEDITHTKYGTLATYEAPDYSAGNNVRDVTVTATADDFDRGNENPTNKGYKESDDDDSITLKVWQVTVTAQQSGTTSSNYDGPTMPERFGDTDLGWITPASDPNTDGYYGNTQIKGSIPSGPGVTTGYAWYQYITGHSRYKVNGGSWVYDANYPSPHLDVPPPVVNSDTDSMSDGEDVREIFLLDAPGWWAYTSNDRYIDPENWSDKEISYDLEIHVEYGGNQISNTCDWDTDYVLDVNEIDSTWMPVGGHTPEE